jgi:hypothetical protein
LLEIFTRSGIGTEVVQTAGRVADLKRGRRAGTAGKLGV